MPGISDHMSTLKISKQDPGDHPKLCSASGERSMDIYEILATSHKEAGETLQGHNDVQAQAVQY